MKRTRDVSTTVFLSAAYLFCTNCVLKPMRTNGCVHFVGPSRAITVIKFNNQRSKMLPKIIKIILMNTKIKRLSGRGETSPIAPHRVRETSPTHTEATVNEDLK